MNRTKQRVLLGMSGGVDSSVAGYLLRENGLRRSRRDDEGLAAGLHLARRGQMLRALRRSRTRAGSRIRWAFHITWSTRPTSSRRVVIDYFSSEYQAGRTPNPCVMCNEKLKFGSLWEKARALDCDYIATGHYAIIEHHPDRAVLRKGVDPRKDQSYFLFSLRQPQLRHALTPLGAMAKSEVREIARSLGLKVADKVDSQEICFVPGND